MASFDCRKDSPLIRAATRAFSEALLADLLEPLRLAARGCGYALTVHGSLARDIDLVAIPWEKMPSEPDELVERICGVLAGYLGRGLRMNDWTEKPHGRRAVTIILPGPCPEIDLSVLPALREQAS